MNFPYAVIPLGILLFYFYLFSTYLMRAGIFRKNMHRRIWNYILLITFLVTALSGLFIALQINHKWEFSWVDKFLKWHVDFGIALSFTGIFHFLWHWNYYFSKKPRKTEQLPGAVITGNLSPVPAINLFHLGFVTLATQVIFIRAGLNLFEGNELVTGLIISIWMLSTGLGAVAGRYSSRLANSEDAGYIGLIITGVLPSLMLPVLYLVKIWFFPMGTSPGILSTVFVTVLILLPFCFISGVYFIVYAFRLKVTNTDFAGRSYFLESTGSLVAGLFTGFISVFLFSLFQTSLILILFTISILLLHYSQSKFRKIVFSLVALFTTLLLFIHPGHRLEKLVYHKQDLMKIRQTPYGQIVVTKTSGQINIFENNTLLYSGPDISNTEETVHFPLSQVNNTDSLLLISGGYKGLLIEMLKYAPRQIDYTETDPALISLARQYSDS
ncbi:MAG TPA: hypothetical protein VE870_16710, partial [Bacteroidales bacterium]|nr:hypothetical protein [Bacteroidales bacterium]